MRDGRSTESGAFARSDRTYRRIRLWLDVLEQAAVDVAIPARRFDALNDLLDAMSYFGRPELARLLSGLRDEYDALRQLVSSWDPDEGPSRADEQRLPAMVARLVEATEAVLDVACRDDEVHS
jgi:hypothetical protein